MSFGPLMESRQRDVPVRDARLANMKHATEHIIYGFMPALATLGLIVYVFKLHSVAADFHDAYYPAAKRLLDGANPYAVTPSQVAAGLGFVYPALSALLFAPFALLGNGVASVIDMLLGVACVPAILWTLNVRDWRVYGVMVLLLPVFDGWPSGNLTLPLALMVALAWRHRDRPWAAGLLAAAAISIKPFAWPLGLWLLATRRWKAAAWALVSGVAVNLLALGPGRVQRDLDLPPPLLGGRKGALAGGIQHARRRAPPRLGPLDRRVAAASDLRGCRGDRHLSERGETSRAACPCDGRAADAFGLTASLGTLLRAAANSDSVVVPAAGRDLGSTDFDVADASAPASLWLGGGARMGAYCAVPGCGAEAASR
jgi:hypothetical protein